MCKDMFFWLVNFVFLEILRRNIRLWKVIFLVKWVVIVLWRLVGGGSFCEVFIYFDVGKLFCVIIIKEFCCVLNRFLRCFIKLLVNYYDMIRVIVLF